MSTSIIEKYRDLLKGGPILNSEKLSLANHKVYFKALKIWAITRGVLWAFDNTLESIQKRKVIEKDEK